MRLKGFLFTIDALLAVAIISVTAYAIIALSVQPVNLEKSYALEKIGRDALSLTADGVSITKTEFGKLTGKTIYTDSLNLPDAPLVARAVLYKYPKLCQCDATNKCITTPIAHDDDCWDTQDIELFDPDNLDTQEYKYKHEAWVTP